MPESSHAQEQILLTPPCHQGTIHKYSQFIYAVPIWSWLLHIPWSYQHHPLSCGSHLRIRTSSPGPLFLFRDGTTLSRATLVAHLRTALAQVGIDASQYSGHSFRIGAATSAAQAGYSDSFIRSLGRWKSAAFITYIRISPSDLAAVAPVLVGQGR